MHHLATLKVTAATADMLSKALASVLRAKVEDNATHQDPAWYTPPSKQVYVVFSRSISSLISCKPSTWLCRYRLGCVDIDLGV
jgi:hypothetical protein